MASKIPILALASATIVCCCVLARERLRPSHKRVSRSLLPNNLSSWRYAGVDRGDSPYPDPWPLITDFLQELGYELWHPHTRMGSDCLCAYQLWGLPTTNLGHHFFSHALDPPQNATLFDRKNGLVMPARHSAGFDVVIRVVSAGGQGDSELQVLRKLGTGEHALQPLNHVLPMFEEIVFDDIVFGVFPYITATALSFDLGTAGDMINIILQCLEATVYIHDCLVAHQDLFIDNFMLEYLPRSSTHGATAVFPRVYLIDFESAVSFPANSRPEDRLVSSHYFGDQCARPSPPELKAKGVPFDPFALDVWQLAKQILTCSTTNDLIDGVIAEMSVDDAASRPTAKEAFERILTIYRRIPPIDLDLPPGKMRPPYTTLSSHSSSHLIPPV